MIGYGLGPTGEKWVTGIFVIEVCIWMYVHLSDSSSASIEQYSVALVVLFSDSLNAVWPVLTSDQWKIIGLVA